MATRRIAAVMALMTGIVLALVSVPSQAGARPSDLCLLDCSTLSTAATTPAAVTTPAASGPLTVFSVSATSAAFAANFSPGAYLTAYRFEVLDGSQAIQDSSWLSLPAGGPAATLSYRASGLVPSTSYSVRLAWIQLSAGKAISGGSTAAAFTTPIEPPAVPSLVANTDQIDLGQSVTLTGSAAANPLGSLVSLQGLTAPGDAFSPYLSATGPVLGTIAAVVGSSAMFTETPLRNTAFRLRLPGTTYAADAHAIQEPSVSNVVFVDVSPLARLITVRPRNTATVQAQVNYAVHALSSGFRGEQVYFYDGTSAKTTGMLVGHARLRQTSPNLNGTTRLSATVEFSDVKTSYVRACVRHAVLADMGASFTDTACGGPLLAPGAD